ncbi:hypothetical protein CGMCC3_g7770 [Colletotrichum fructicola]|nr:uncharacterized protein CGMCC3_g7770 [Colletotrichum fructicola]KAE9576102.1 hypothetical protein CGMCC3_g7770 [Colletotrichum fructicola]
MVGDTLFPSLRPSIFPRPVGKAKQAPAYPALKGANLRNSDVKEARIGKPSASISNPQAAHSSPCLAQILISQTPAKGPGRLNEIVTKTTCPFEKSNQRAVTKV